MTVKELIEKLKEADLNEEVTVSCDPEGNEFSSLGRVELELNDNNQNVVSLYPSR
jgi:hypothetical protein